MNPAALEKYRTKNKLNCSQLCEKMGRTAGWYSRIRSGKFPLKSKDIPKMAEIFGISPEKLAKEYFTGSKLEDSSDYEGVI